MLIFLQHYKINGPASATKLESDNMIPEGQSEETTDNTLKRKASGASLQDEVPAKQSKGGRPGTKPKRYSRGSTKLDSSRRVTTALHMDVWEQIFQRCEPKVLKDVRTICRSFCKALERPSIWKAARQLHFGSDCPNPPPNLTEMQYSDLLSINRCQSHRCNKLVREVNWACGRRWCSQHLKENIVASAQLRALNDFANYGDPSKVLPKVTFDHLGIYMWVGDYDTVPDWAAERRVILAPWAGRAHPDTRVFFPKHTMDKLDVDLRTFKSTLLQEDGAGFAMVQAMNNAIIGAWVKVQDDNNKAVVAQLQKIEAWSAERQITKSKEAKDHAEKRKIFYKERALQLNPPLEPEALEQCPSYIRVASIPKPATEFSWALLRGKLGKERGAAEEDVRQKKEKELRARRMTLFRACSTVSFLASEQQYFAFPASNLFLRPRNMTQTMFYYASYSTVLLPFSPKGVHSPPSR